MTEFDDLFYIYLSRFPHRRGKAGRHWPWRSTSALVQSNPGIRGDLCRNAAIQLRGITEDRAMISRLLVRKFSEDVPELGAQQPTPYPPEFNLRPAHLRSARNLRAVRPHPISPAIARLRTIAWSTHPPGHDRLFNARQVAEKLGVSERWVRDHTTSPVAEESERLKLGTLMRYRWADVEAFLAESRYASGFPPLAIWCMKEVFSTIREGSQAKGEQPWH